MQCLWRQTTNLSTLESGAHRSLLVCRHFLAKCTSTRSTSTTPAGDGVTCNINASNRPINADDGPILFLSPSNWPEPNATAAGTRTMSLLQHFSNSSSVHFGCGAKMPQSIKRDDASNTVVPGPGSNHIHWHQIKPNRSEEMKTLLHNIQSNHGPIKAVVFDRFYAEEAFSFRIRDICPDALLVLDMQDIHSLRLGRQCLVEETDSRQSEDGNRNTQLQLITTQLMDNVMNFNPQYDATSFKRANDAFLRELASVHRSDLVLVCSSVEMNLLESSWNVPKWKLVPASFFCKDEDVEDDTTNIQQSSSMPTFEDRQDFVTVGGFKHPPNVDSVKLLRHEIWPRIREQIPNARMHVYGAYPTSQILNMQDKQAGFLVKGHVEDLDKVLTESRVLLSPLRFGAGIKGKIVDAWRCGCPVVTTPVGAEGMVDESEALSKSRANWGGSIASNSNDFIQAAVEMYTQKEHWKSCQHRGTSLLTQLFNGRTNLPVIEDGITDAIMNLKQRRQSDLVGAILWRDAQRSTEYFSRWIELKESLR